jgi:2-oxoglutarate ferredoxin oxidoreductase subunit beta
VTDTAPATTKKDWTSDQEVRWCPGCGDYSILTAVQMLMPELNVKPENTVFVSGIGCSSRLPHYVKTYGFHGIHGRALPIATGVKLHRPDLDVFVVMGDGDCCSIGAGHWIHAIRYNLDLTVLMFDNAIYALTKDQSSPTTPQGYASNTQPKGSYLPALNPLSATLGVTNCSFVAQTAEWAPQHLYETLVAAHRHRGFSFVRILQRCPVFSPDIFQRAVKDPGLIELLVHENGVGGKGLETLYRNQVRHDPSDLDAARRYASMTDKLRLGVLFRDPNAPRYEETRHVAPHTAQERMALLETEFDRYAV